MNHLVRQQARLDLQQVRVNEALFANPVVAGFVVFEAEVGDVVAECHQEMVGAIMVRAEERVRLAHQAGIVTCIFRFQLQGRRAVGHDVEAVRRLTAGAEVHCVEIGARDHRRVHQCLQRYRLKSDDAAGLTGGRERSAEPPPRRQAQRRGELDFAGFGSFRIEQHVAPTEIYQLRRGRAVRAAGREIIQCHVERGGAGGHLDGEGVHVLGIAPPLDGLAGSAQLQPGQVGGGAGGGVLARQPFGVHQRELAGLDRDLQAGMEDLARGIGGIHVQCDRRVPHGHGRRGQQARGSGPQAKIDGNSGHQWAKSKHHG